MLPHIGENPVLFPLSSVRRVGASLESSGKNAAAAAISAGVDGTPGLFDGGERDFQFRGEFFIGRTRKRGIEKALLGAGKAEDGLLVYKQDATGSGPPLDTTFPQCLCGYLKDQAKQVFRQVIEMLPACYRTTVQLFKQKSTISLPTSTGRPANGTPRDIRDLLD